MEAPEKIYLHPDIGDREFIRPWLEMRVNKDSVEYVNKDVFVEKALKWYCLDCECNDNCAADHKCFFRQQFECYLEGNNTCLPPKIDNAFNPNGSTTGNYRYRHIIRRMQDAFVEKAVKWLDGIIYDYIELKHANIDTFIDIDNKRLVKDFKKYMGK